MKKLFLLFALSGMVAVGCSKELLDENNTFDIPAEGGTVVIPHKTTVACEVIIPEEAQTWITITTATSGSVTYNTTLNIAANNSGKQRSSVVKVISQEYNEVFAEYTITQGTRYCICYTSSDGKIVKPQNSSSFDATILSNTYKDGSGIIEFNAPITSIGEYAFGGCWKLTSVTIPDSVTSIGELAFYECSSLTNVTIPDSVTSIGKWAFWGCSSLTSVIIGDGVTSIGERAFINCSSLTSVTIPDSVTSIERGAFTGCSSLQEINGKFASEDSRCLIIEGILNSFAPAGITEYSIPDSVTSIGERSFLDCSNLTSVTIPDSVTSIEWGAFDGCSSLISVTIPDSVTSIGERAFRDCSSLTSATIGDCVTEIGICAFENCSSLQEINGKFAAEDGRCLIIDGVLNSFAPAGITEYSIPDSVTSIGNSAFDGCSSLTCVTIPDNVTSIGELAFYECSSLTNVTIPDSVTSIGEWAFYECSSLTCVTIGNGVTSIGAGAFYDCSSLTNVYCKPTTPPAGDYDIFTGNASGRKIYVPIESVEAYKNASHWSDYASDIVGYNFQ